MAWQPKGNIKGPKGDTGLTGATGPPGATGQAEQWWSGTSAPSGAQGLLGDWWLNTTNGDVYEKTASSAWTLRGNIKGPQGATGSQGAAGTPGADGELWWSGSGAPQTTTGAIGDWYINTANSDIYEKTGSAAWTFRMNIKGATGATGSQGPQGNTGATGSQGAQGPQGPAGTTPPPSVGIALSASSNPTGTANTNGVMMGLGRSPNLFLFTPTIANSTFMLIISASLASNVASATSVVGLRWGTGTAPLNGAAAVGTLGPAYVRAGATAANEPDFFTIVCVVTGLPVGTQHWCDLIIQAGAAGQTTSVTGCFFQAVEIP